MNSIFTYPRSIVTQCHDGDTVTMDIDLGFGIWKRGEKFRLFGPDPTNKMGMNCPELNTPEGIVARDFLSGMLAEANWRVQLTTVKDRQEKYGRFLAVLFDMNKLKNLNQAMVDAGHAVLRQYFPFQEQS